ncbi:hypothetical protein [Streptomyces apocyni]|uniref:hypothetical protein n=1 Tax=Streptomyces apocyni TaxID=2654677 RepID=UPI0012EAE45A|nr:hypothetical protein [Streptomyces apocyni]
MNGRLGGEVALLLAQAGGPDIVRAALSVALGQPPDLRSTGPARYAAAFYVPFPTRSGPVRLAPGIAGLVTAAEDPPSLRRLLLGAFDEVASLFAADEAEGNPWSVHVRAGLRDSLGRTGTLMGPRSR